MSRKRRTYNTRLIRRNLSYSIQEIAELYDLHKNAVLRWVKGGLPIIDERKPYLIHGAELAGYLSAKQNKRKRPLEANEFYCCKCRCPRPAWENQVDIIIRNKSKLSLAALCAVCETIMHRAGSAQKLAEYQNTFSIQTIQEPRITERISPLVMCDNRKDDK